MTVLSNSAAALWAASNGAPEALDWRSRRTPSAWDDGAPGGPGLEEAMSLAAALRAEARREAERQRGRRIQAFRQWQRDASADEEATNAVLKDEIFGPVLAIRTFSTEEEAVAMANDSPYGLAHSVMSADVERCTRVAARLESGIVWQNCSQPLFVNTPFGGKKQSGFGRELGSAGLNEYLHEKTVIGAAAGTSWEWYGSP